MKDRSRKGEQKPLFFPLKHKNHRRPFLSILPSHAGMVSLFILGFLLLSHAHAFMLKRVPGRIYSSAMQLQLPSDVASLLPTDGFLEGVSWKDAALYGGLPLLGLSYIISRPPARLVTGQELTQLLQGTNLQGRSDIACLYKASRDGWSATDFHESVDNLGSALVVARSLTGSVFGGYNPAGWRSTDDYVTSTAAFLWSRQGNALRKFPILPGGNAAVFDYATSGPNFGSGDLQIGPSQAAVMGGFAGPDAEDISTSAGNLRSCKSVAGITYDVTPAWPARGQLVLSEVEVYGRY